MQEIWNRIETWCHAYAPEIVEGWNPGATEEQIQEAETFLGVTFPDEMRELYKLHNGQRGEEAPGFLHGEWLSLARIVDEWGKWKGLLDDGTFNGISSEPDTGVRNDWWNPAWIPLTYDGSGNHYCLDLDPTEDGKQGQIIKMWHDDRERPLVTDSLTEWLSSIADKLESGEWVFSLEDYNGTIARDDLFDDEEWRGVDKHRFVS